MNLRILAATIILLLSGAAPCYGQPLAERPLPPEILYFAAQAVQLPVPMGWNVFEVPHGREIRLVLLPADVRLSNQLNEGIWLSYHVLPEEAESTGEQTDLLVAMNRSRLQAIVGNTAVLNEPVLMRLSHWPAVEQEFVLAPATRRLDGEPPARRGQHVSARTPWGIFEMHFSAPADRYGTREPAFRQLLAQLKLAAPHVDQTPPAEQVRDALPILGTWKSYRSRVWFGASGRVRMVMDPPNIRAIDEAAPPQVLSGRYTAQHDLVQVEWDDGSRLNLRWTFSGQDLLLTDHEGQPSRLRRILE